MDNLGSHKGRAIRQAIRRAGARLFLEATWKRIGTLLERFTETECANYLLNAGYASK